MEPCSGARETLPIFSLPNCEKFNLNHTAHPYILSTTVLSDSERMRIPRESVYKRGGTGVIQIQNVYGKSAETREATARSCSPCLRFRQCLAYFIV